MAAAFANGSATDVLGYYADNYLHQDGETKADLADYLQWYFGNFTIVGVAVDSNQFTVDSSGDHVTQNLSERVTEQDKGTGAQDTYGVTTVVQWTNAGGQWVITSAEDGAIQGP